jgi:hypothetical protein
MQLSPSSFPILQLEVMTLLHCIVHHIIKSLFCFTIIVFSLRKSFSNTKLVTSDISRKKEDTKHKSLHRVKETVVIVEVKKSLNRSGSHGNEMEK